MMLGEKVRINLEVSKVFWRTGMDTRYSETIAAISTAVSSSGIGIVRMTGEDAFEIADQVYIGKNIKS